MDRNSRPKVKIVNANVNVVNGDYIRTTTYKSRTLSHSLNVEEQYADPDGHSTYTNGPADHCYPRDLRETEAMAIQRAGANAIVYRNIQSNTNCIVESSVVLNANDVQGMSDGTSMACDALFDHVFDDSQWIGTCPADIQYSQGAHALSNNSGLQTIVDLTTQTPNVTEHSTTTTSTNDNSFAYTAITHSVTLAVADPSPRDD